MEICFIVGKASHGAATGLDPQVITSTVHSATLSQGRNSDNGGTFYPIITFNNRLFIIQAHLAISVLCPPLQTSADAHTKSHRSHYAKLSP